MASTGRPADPVDPHESPWHLLGAELRNWRRFRGYETLESLANVLHMDASILGKYEKAKRAPSAEVVRRLDDQLKAGGVLTALHAMVMARKPAGDSSQGAAPPHADDMDLSRRRLLASIAAVGVAGALPLDAVEQTRHAMSASMGGDQLADWEETVWEYGHTVLRQPPAALLTDLTLDAHALQQAIVRRPPGDERGWARVNAAMAFLMARTLGFCGQPREARHWWQTARRAADLAGSVDLQAAARGFDATQALYAGRPDVVVLQRTDDALHVSAGRACAGAAEALAMRAQAAAVAGRSEIALRELEALERLVDQLPGAVIGDTETAFGWPVTRLLHTRSYVLSRVGDLHAASAASDEALAAYPAWEVRHISQVEMHRAVTAVRDGDITHGIGHARAVLERLPEHDWTMFVRVAAADVARAVPLGEANRPPVAAYRQLLALPSAPAQ
ncbi:helix-turn-helix domain-containing protein [Microbispora sp. NBC_01189]|uniref:helix-turn-helix domain-containing protein n=1 Tax=Microbispora sp. NBC_01189 TaxID=2903583 RepID=UPI002E0F81E1|nr:helix-turn-helix domain-containing protein [Microbispora sp. NBC_01189]